MDTAPSATPLSPAPPSTNSSRLAWFFASLVCTVAISLAAAHAPPRIRLIGLFSMAFGLLIGGVLTWLARAMEIDLSHRFMGLMAAALTFGGLIGSTCELVRVETIKRSKSPNNAVALRIMEEMDKESKPADSLVSKPTMWEEFRRHLTHRIRQLGEWPSPWPEVFWLAELLAGATASFWISNRRRPTVSHATDG